MSSRIILENNEGRIGMGFDASEVGRDPDAERLLRSSYSPSMNYEVRRLQKMLRSFGIDRRLASFQGSIAHGVARSVAPSLARSVTPSMARSIESLRSAAMSSLSSSTMQSFEVHGLDPAHSASWSLRRVPSVRTPALQSLLKSVTTIGPIVISPDDEDVPLAYQPDLQGWLIPETATDVKDDIDVEELRIQMVATVVRIARDDRTKALIRGLGKDGRTLLIQVAGTIIGTYIWYWLTQH